MVEHFDAQLTLLHVVLGRPRWYADSFTGFHPIPIDQAELVRRSQATMDSYLLQELEHLKPERVVLEGEPAEVITEFANKLGADLIMLPTHGYGAFRRLLLGSVAAKVLHDARCAVWTDVHESSSSPRDSMESVVCAVDLSEESLGAIRWASCFAESYKSDLYLVHAIPSLEWPSGPQDETFRRSLIETAREFIGDLQRKAGTSAKVCLEGGKIASVVRDAARQHNAGLVVIGQGSIQGILGGLRTNSYAIIRDSPCPVVRI
jgi:nucleotide-binding universal stress UspA family protein